jgi:glycosyltransferase involved in cell wall biosynthesis
MLSLAIIAMDEADRIERCIRSVPVASEVIVVDSGSSDGTPELAEQLGARVVRTDWPGHVAQKNRALALASRPWVLSLDADEWLEPEAVDALGRALRQPGRADGFSFARCSRWLGRPIRHGRWYPDRKVRVARRGLASWVGDDPHDQLEVRGRVRVLDGEIGHEPYRHVAEHLRTIDRYTAVHARSLHARGVRWRWWRTALGPPLHFVDALVMKRGFQDGADGLVLATLGATHTWMKWSRLRELERRRCASP